MDRSRRHRIRLAMVFITAHLLFAGVALAQNSGIQGVVTDQSEAVVPGVGITVTNVATGIQYNAETNSLGFYSVPFLNPGTYSVQAAAAGFTTVTRENLKLDVQQIARVDFTLNIGTVVETVEVSAAAALLESESTTVGQVIENKRIVEMPLNQRNYLELATLTTGILPAATLEVGNRTGRQLGDGGVLGMGQHGAQTMVLLDGVDNNARASGGALGFLAQGSRPSVDAVGEFKVVTNNTSAEYGFRMGPKVLVSIKSGTNAFHGSAYEFFRNDRLDGTNFFANRSGSTKPPLRQNQFGATIGGPIIRDKTFFFFSYEGTRIRIGQSFLRSVPSAAALSGDFSNERRNLNRVFDPLTTVGSGGDAIREQFPNNQVPRSRMDPVSLRVAGRFPTANVQGREFLANNFFSSPSDAQDTNQYDWRVDHNFSSTDRVFFRYSVRRKDIVKPGPLPIETGADDGETVDINADNLAFNWTHSFSPTIHNEARFGFMHFPTKFDIIPQPPLNEELGIKGAPGDAFGDGLNGSFSYFDFSSYADLGRGCCWPNQNNMDNVHVSDNLMVQKGAHLLKFGVDFRRLNIFREAQRNRRGRFQFQKRYTTEQPNVGSSRSVTGNDLAEMLLGTAWQTTVGNQAGENGIVPYWGAYIQDDWKITPRLTMNIGFRWEFFGTTYYPIGNRVGRQGVSNFITAFSGVPANDSRIGTFERPEDGSDCGCEHDLNNFAPRLGFAYRLNNRTVLRTGFGVYFGEADNLHFEHKVFHNQTPDFTEVTARADNITPAAIVQEGFAPVQLPASEPVAGTSPNTSPIKRIDQYSAQWFFDVQRELPGDILFSVGYQGMSSSQLGRYIRISNGGPHPTIPESRRRVFPMWNNVTWYGFGNNASFNALLTRLEKRFTRGLTFLISHTWSHNIDAQVQRYDSEQFNIANWYDLGGERGNALLDHRQSLTLSYTYELPFGRGRAVGSDWSGAMDAILGGWELGGILTLRDGFPIDMNYPGDPQNSGSRNRGDRVASGKLDNPTIDRWFDESAFVESAPGVFGTTGRNVLFGPGTARYDFILAKRFFMPWEGHQLQFRFESFNFTNTPKFGQPDTRLRRASTATINRADDPRRIQFGLKYVF